MTPATEAELAACIADAFAARMPLAIIGNASLAAIGRPVRADRQLSTSALSGIVAYEPEELMITLRPGTLLAEVEETLARKRQMLAFEPPALGLLHGRTVATVGGIIGANLSGPRRFRAGAARDHLLAVRAIGGRGECFKAGGKVVKNVTGYDLPKLLAGSWGTLAVLSEMTLKVMPLPAHQATIVAPAGDIAAALGLLRKLAGDPTEPSGLALVPADAAADESAIALRFEGDLASARERAHSVRAQLAGAQLIEGEPSGALWRNIGLGCDSSDPGGPLWRLSIPPADALAHITAARPARWVADQAGGLLWLDRPAQDWSVPSGDVSALCVRGGMTTTGPVDAAVLALSRRLKAAFDPAGILNPGRLFAEHPDA